MKNISWQVGEVKITSLVETDASEIIQSIIPKATVDSIKEMPWLKPFFVDEFYKLKAVVQSFIIEVGNVVIIVDTCIGNSKERIETGAWNKLQTDFLQRFRDLGLNEENVNFVLCTHLHFDHVGWNTKLERGKWVPTFPNAQYLFAEKEFDYWKGVPEKEIQDDHAGFRDSVQPIIDAKLYRLIPTNFHIVQGVRIIETPGHTPFHVSVLIESAGQSALITGDAMHHPCQIGEPSWETLADTIPDMAISTRKKILQKYSETSTIIIGSHFSPPTSGLITTENGKYVLSVNKQKNDC